MPNTEGNLAIGLDIGGTDTKAVIVDAAGKRLHESVEPTTAPDRRAKADFLARLRERLDRLRAGVDRPIEHLGIAIPGMASRDERCAAWLPAGKLDLQDVDFAEAFGWPRPVSVLNDAHAALLGEVWCGGAVNRRDVVLLTLGTGVGGAILSDGKLIRGTLGRAGHLGHIGIGTGSPPSVCNMPGALEDAIGEQTLKGRARDKFDSTEALVSAVKAGNVHAKQVWETSVTHLAYAIASFINMLDPELIVISGGIAKAGEALFAPLRKQIEQIEWKPTGTSVPIVPAKLGSWAGAIGAAGRAMSAAQ